MQICFDYFLTDTYPPIEDDIVPFFQIGCTCQSRLLQIGSTCKEFEYCNMCNCCCQAIILNWKHFLVVGIMDSSQNSHWILPYRLKCFWICNMWLKLNFTMFFIIIKIYSKRIETRSTDLYEVWSPNAFCCARST